MTPAMAWAAGGGTALPMRSRHALSEAVQLEVLFRIDQTLQGRELGSRRAADARCRPGHGSRPPDGPRPQTPAAASSPPGSATLHRPLSWPAAALTAPLELSGKATVVAGCGTIAGLPSHPAAGIGYGVAPVPWYCRR